MGIKNRNQDSEPTIIEKPNDKPAGKPAGKPKKCCSSLILFRQLYLLQAGLKQVVPRIARSSDRVLASIAYPSRFISYLIKNAQLLKLSTVIGDYRTLTRLVSTPATILYALDMFLDNKNPDLLDRIGDYLQGISAVLYQVFEDLAYLGDKGIINLTPKQRSYFWVWSSMSWAIDIAVSILRAPYYRYVLHKPVNLRSLVVNLAWAPLCYHWSTHDGVFGNGVVGALGSLACWPTLVYQWTRPL